jgi:hypothetical protein
VRRIQVLFEATRPRPVSRRIVLKSTTGKLEALSKFLEEKNLTSTLRGKALKNQVFTRTLSEGKCESTVSDLKASIIISEMCRIIKKNLKK